MTIDKQALRQLATDAHELGIIKRYTKGIEANKRFVAIVTPLTVLALLDELEAAEKRIAELEAREVVLPKPLMVLLSRSGESINAWPAYTVDSAIRAAGIKIK